MEQSNMYLWLQMGKATIIEINYTNWQKHLTNGLILVDFWAPWCTACKYQDPILDELLIIFENKLNIGKIDINDNRFLANRYGVKNIPTIILFSNGELINRMPGIENKEDLIRIIKKHII